MTGSAARAAMPPRRRALALLAGLALLAPLLPVASAAACVGSGSNTNADGSTTTSAGVDGDCLADQAPYPTGDAMRCYAGDPHYDPDCCDIHASSCCGSDVTCCPPGDVACIIFRAMGALHRRVGQPLPLLGGVCAEATVDPDAPLSSPPPSVTTGGTCPGMAAGPLP